MEQRRHYTGLLPGQDARIPRHIVDIHLVFRPTLKEKTTLWFPNSQLPSETSTANENVGGDPSGGRETPQVQISGFT